MGIGLLDDADVTLTTDYGTAKDVFVSGNQQAGMQAFMAGKVKVQGDMTKLMMSGQGGGGNEALNDRHPGHHGVAQPRRVTARRTSSSSTGSHSGSSSMWLIIPTRSCRSQ